MCITVCEWTAVACSPLEFYVFINQCQTNQINAAALSSSVTRKGLCFVILDEKSCYQLMRYPVGCLRFK